MVDAGVASGSSAAPEWFDGGAPPWARLGIGAFVHPKKETLERQRWVIRPKSAKPRVPATRRRRENVMQSTNGSSPRGLLT
jgi:hypothetical protein